MPSFPEKPRPPATGDRHAARRRPRPEILLPAAAILLAFSLRLIFFLQLAASPIAEFLVEDSRVYHEWARLIAGGGLIGDDVFHALPLYPYFLGLIYAVTGGGIQTARLVQVIMGTVNCFLLYRLGRKLFRPAVATTAVFLMAIYKLLIVYDSALLSPVLIVFLSCLLLLALIRVRESGDRIPGWLGVGLLTGIGAAASAHLLAFVPLALIWAVFTTRENKWIRKPAVAGAYLAGVMVAIAPFTLHNLVAGDDFVPLTAHSGINFFIGNNPASRGVFEPPPVLRTGGATLQQDAARFAQAARGRSLKPSEINSFWFQKGLEFIRGRPGEFLSLLGRKFVIFWDSLEIADVIHPHFFVEFAPILKLPFLTFGIVAPFSLLGMILTWKTRRRTAALYLFVAAWIISTILFFVNARYRLPLAPFLLLFAAYSLVWFRDRVKARKWLPAGCALVALGGLAVFVNPQIFSRPRFRLSLGAGHNHLGTFYFQRGELEEAEREFTLARDLEPRRAEAHYNLANVHFRLDRIDEARQGYERAIALNPAYESAHLALALVYEREGKTGEARDKYLEIINNAPRLLHPRLRLAHLNIYQDAGSPEEAIVVLEEALSLEPGAPPVYSYLAEAYLRLEQTDRAIEILERGIDAAGEDDLLLLQLGATLLREDFELDRARGILQEAARRLPGRFDSHLYLGDYYFRVGDLREAEASWRRALSIRPGDRAILRRLETIRDYDAE